MHEKTICIETGTNLEVYFLSLVFFGSGVDSLVRLPQPAAASLLLFRLANTLRCGSV